MIGLFLECIDAKTQDDFWCLRTSFVWGLSSPSDESLMIVSELGNENYSRNGKLQQ
jgi:hypothetical protein